MKKTRRQELKTNELSIYIQQIYQAAQRNVNYLIGGIVVVVLVLVIAMFFQQKRHSALQAAWSNYNEIRNMNVANQPSLIDRARTLAANYGDDPELGPAVLQQKADLAYELAMKLNAAEDQATRIERLHEAKETYEELVAKFGDRPLFPHFAKMSLAGVEEALCTQGESDIQQVRALYQQIVADDSSAFQKLAQERLDTLDERLAKLEVVTSRPAEQPIATKPAPSIMGAAATAPAK